MCIRDSYQTQTFVLKADERKGEQHVLRLQPDATALDPVSYTHLDVYKRQVPSLYNLLVRLKNEGYNVGKLPANPQELAKMIQAQGAVFGTYAEGALSLIHIF